MIVVRWRSYFSQTVRYYHLVFMWHQSYLALRVCFGTDSDSGRTELWLLCCAEMAIEAVAKFRPYKGRPLQGLQGFRYENYSPGRTSGGFSRLGKEPKIQHYITQKMFRRYRILVSMNWVPQIVLKAARSARSIGKMEENSSEAAVSILWKVWQTCFADHAISSLETAR